MTVYTLATAEQLLDWAKHFDPKVKSMAFRGQSDCNWRLTPSLARYFKAKDVPSDEWRSRELKMYALFRNRLRSICHELYDDCEPLDILAMMQHHGIPTRLIDFTYSPMVAAYFALTAATADCIVWMVDPKFLRDTRQASSAPDYCGPSHSPQYTEAQKHHDIASIMTPRRHNARSAAQYGCFLVPGRISPHIPDGLIHGYATISEDIVRESLTKLKGLGIDRESLFPDLEAIAQETLRFAVTGRSRYAEATVAEPLT